MWPLPAMDWARVPGRGRLREEWPGAGDLRTGLACPGHWQAARKALGRGLSCSKQDAPGADGERLTSGQGWRAGMDPRQQQPPEVTRQNRVAARGSVV